MNKLIENLNKVASNKSLSSREAQVLDSTTFREIAEAMKKGKITNDPNRESELDSKSTYQNKLNHLLRFISSISQKSQLLISILRDDTTKVGQIRDDGTLTQLAFGDYFDKRVLTPNEIITMIDDDIIDGYKVDGSTNLEFFDMVKEFLDSKSNQEKEIAVSLEEIVNSSDEINTYYYDTNLQYTIDLLTIHQSALDTRNANLQPNARVGYDFYMNPFKYLKEYKETFCGKAIIKWVNGKFGLTQFPDKKPLRDWKSKADGKKVHRVTPLYHSHIISNLDSIDDVIKGATEIVRFKDYKRKLTFTYWTNKFRELVTTTKFSNLCDGKDSNGKEVVGFYHKYFLPVWNNSAWDEIYEQVQLMIASLGKKKSSQALNDLKLTKYDTGIWFISLAIWFKLKYTTIGIDKIVRHIVDEYKKQLAGKIDVDGTTMTITKAFGNEKGFTNIDARVNYLFKHVAVNVKKRLDGKKKDRKQATILGEDAYTKHSSLLKLQGHPSSITLYPLASEYTDEGTVNLNFATGGGGQWTHPNDKENKAEDGFYGLSDDNLKEPLKSMNWKDENSNYVVETQQDYWKHLLLLNSKKMLQTDCPIEKGRLQIATTVLDYLTQVDCQI